MPPARLFVAVWPPPAVLDLLSALPRPAVPGLRWTTPGQWHVTLRFLGSVDPDEASVAFGRVAPDGPVVARLGPAVGRFGATVLQVPVGGLDGTAVTVAAAMSDGGPPFRGHLTLARVRRPGRVDLAPLTGAAVSARWSVDELTLVRSHLGPAGARYEVVARRPVPTVGA